LRVKLKEKTLAYRNSDENQSKEEERKMLGIFTQILNWKNNIEIHNPILNLILPKLFTQQVLKIRLKAKVSNAIVFLV